MYLSDSLTIGLIFGILLFAVALYLYTAISHTEQKISLLESILLDLKISNELQSYSDGKKESPVNGYNGSNTSSTEEQHLAYESFKEDESKDVLEPLDNEDLEETADFLPLNVTVPPTKPLTPVPENPAVPAVPAVPTVSTSRTVDPTDVTDLTDDSPVNYDTMSLKELQALAKSKGLTGSMKRAALLDALKSKSTQQSLWSSSLVENSAPFSNE
jgi:hypothetical protein